MPRILLLLPTTTWRAEAFMSAAARLGLGVTVATNHDLVWTRRDPERFITLDFRRPDVAAAEVEAHAREHRVDAVVGVDDDTTVVAAAIAARLGLPHNPVEALAAVRDKHRQREVLSRAGLPVPAFTACRLDDDPATVGERVGFPCVIKPLRLAASRGVIRADDAAGLGAAMRRLSALLATPDVEACGEAGETALVESFIPGREVALEGLIHDGALRPLALFDKPDPLDGPFFEESIYLTPSRLPDETQLAIYVCASRAIQALGLVRGPVHAELRINEQGPWIVEIAARPIGGLCSRVLRFGEDATLEEVILRQALGMETAHLVRESGSAGVMMVPIPGAGVLERVEGIEEAARVPGIDSVIVTVHPGERLVPFPEGSRYPGFIFARGATSDGVEQALRAAHDRLRFVLAGTGMELKDTAGAMG